MSFHKFWLCDEWDFVHKMECLKDLIRNSTVKDISLHMPFQPTIRKACLHITVHHIIVTANGHKNVKVQWLFDLSVLSTFQSALLKFTDCYSIIRKVTQETPENICKWCFYTISFKQKCSDICPSVLYNNIKILPLFFGLAELDFIPDRPPECGPCREAEPWR